MTKAWSFWPKASGVLFWIGLTLLPPGAARAAEPSLSGNFLPAIIASSPPHRESLVALIRGKPGLPPWVRNMVSRDRYVALASTRIEVDGQPMQLFRACQPGACVASALRILYSADGKRAVLRVADVKLGTLVFGAPTPAELAVLAAP